MLGACSERALPTSGGSTEKMKDPTGMPYASGAGGTATASAGAGGTTGAGGGGVGGAVATGAAGTGVAGTGSVGAAGMGASGAAGSGTGAVGAVSAGWTAEGSMLFRSLESPVAAMSADGTRVAESGIEGPSSPGAFWANDGGGDLATEVPFAMLSSQFPQNTVTGMDAAGALVIGNASYRLGGTLRASPNDPWQEAFRWSSAVGLIGLGFTKPAHDKSSAVAVSADGSVIAGTSARSSDGFSNQDQEAFIWAPALGTFALGALAGDTMSRALALSADGGTLIGGSSTDAVEGGRLFSWSARDGLSAISPLLTGARFLSASVSRDGTVVAGTLLWDGEPGGGGVGQRTEAFQWTAAAGLHPLGTLPGRVHSETLGISADGAAVIGWSGSVAPIGSDTRIFRWTEADGMVALPLPAGSTMSYPSAMSADGAFIVGSGDSAAQTIMWGQDLVPRVLFADTPAFLARCHTPETTAVSADGKVLGGFCNPSATPPGSNATGFVARFR